MPMVMVAHSKIAKIFERVVVVRGARDQQGNASIETASRGWFIQLADSNVSWWVGDAKPDYAVGDVVRLTIEPVPA